MPEPSSTHIRASPVDLMLEGRLGLQRLLEETNSESSRLHGELQNTISKLESCQAELVVAKNIAEEVSLLHTYQTSYSDPVKDRTKLALAQVELQQYRSDDSSAAKLVSRYM